MIFIRKNSRVRAARMKLVDSRVAIENSDAETDEASAVEGDIEDEAVTENVERCQEVLLLLVESLFIIQDFDGSC